MDRKFSMYVVHILNDLRFPLKLEYRRAFIVFMSAPCINSLSYLKFEEHRSVLPCILEYVSRTLAFQSVSNFCFAEVACTEALSAVRTASGSNTSACSDILSRNSPSEEERQRI